MKAPTADKGYTLYTLINKDDAKVQFSPYVWRTIIELRYLGIQYTEQQYTYTGIRSELTTKTGDPEVLVPVLMNDEGEWVKESFDVALYLDRAHAVPKGKSLFLHSVGGRGFCRFINLWADTVLAPPIQAVAAPRIWSILPPDSDSLSYFTETRFGSPAAAASALAASRSPQASEHFATARKALKLLDSMLAYQRTQGKRFIGGEFSHADAAVFAWYMLSVQNAPEAVMEVWETEENPEVREWVGEMKALPGWEEEQFAEITL